MSEAVSGNTIRNRKLRQARWAEVAAIILGVLTACAALADWTEGFPRGLIIVGGVSTGILAVAAMLQRGEHATEVRHEKLISEIEIVKAEQVRGRIAVAHAMAALATRMIGETMAPAGIAADPVDERQIRWDMYTAALHDLSGIGVPDDWPTGPLGN